MSVVAAVCTVESTLPAAVYEREPYEVFLAEQVNTRRVIEKLGATVVKWLGRTTYPSHGSEHKWAIECDEVTLTALTLVCKSVTLLE